jgi:hypothetical protein
VLVRYVDKEIDFKKLNTIGKDWLKIKRIIKKILKNKPIQELALFQEPFKDLYNSIPDERFKVAGRMINIMINYYKKHKIMFDVTDVDEILGHLDCMIPLFYKTSIKTHIPKD